MIELKMRDGGPADDPDAERYGYWVVTGPQDEDEVYGQIERARDVDTGKIFFPWYLRRRSSTVHNSTGTYWVDAAQGQAAMLDEALAELSVVWQRDVGEAVIGLPRVPQPEIELPWRE